MVTVIIEMADNGVIKTLEDDSINGAGEPFVSKFLYTFEDDKDFKNRIKFLKELCLDVGLQMGSDLDPKKLEIKTVNKPKKKKEMDDLTKSELETYISEAKRMLKANKTVLEKYEKCYRDRYETKS